jgi:hypothetical protein
MLVNVVLVDNAFDKYSAPFSPILLLRRPILVNVVFVDKTFDKYSAPSSPILLL